ncbi:MAG TPA: hypothetical protein VJV79_06995 [Polyangiaceae bacterium]|nr:hypothetical protein [Polyangiaceae bacterium]
MRAPGSWSLLLAAGFTSSLVRAQPAEPAPPPEAAPSESPAAETAPAPEPALAPQTDRPPAATVPATRNIEAAPSVPVATAPAAASDFSRNFDALPLTLEARVGFNARLGSSFDDATQEETWGANYAFASYLAWKPQFALGLELDHAGLGRVRALTGQTSIDNEYTATGAWLGARVFPIRRERLDLFVNLRIGMVWQHINALGTRRDPMNITVPAQSFSCSDWDGPGFGLGGALGLAYRLGRHLAFVSRVDLSGAHLSSAYLGTCADGIGSVASLSGSVGLAFEFETAPK